MQLPHGWSRMTPRFDEEYLVSCAESVPVMALTEPASMSELISRNPGETTGCAVALPGSADPVGSRSTSGWQTRSRFHRPNLRSRWDVAVPRTARQSRRRWPNAGQPGPTSAAVDRRNGPARGPARAHVRRMVPDLRAPRPERRRGRRLAAAEFFTAAAQSSKAASELSTAPRRVRPGGPGFVGPDPATFRRGRSYGSEVERHRHRTVETDTAAIAHLARVSKVRPDHGCHTSQSSERGKPRTGGGVLAPAARQ